MAKEKYFAAGSPQAALQLFTQRWYLLGETIQSQKRLAEVISDSKEQAANDLYLIYPQGTRDNPNTKPIHRGISFIARQAGVPIVPVVLSHSHETIMPKGANVLNGLRNGMRRILTGQPTTETVAFGTPVDPLELTSEMSNVTNSRQLDAVILNTLSENFRQIFHELGQELPLFMIDAEKDVPDQILNT